MSNHSIDCEICGEDLRGLGGGHDPLCPMPKDSFYIIDKHHKEGLIAYYNSRKQAQDQSKREEPTYY